ncbi:MAG: DUF2214 family protein, partial [Pseudolabrys sp.]
MAFACRRSSDLVLGESRLIAWALVMPLYKTTGPFRSCDFKPRFCGTAARRRRLARRSLSAHVAAFTLVSALAVEFVLVRQELTLATARRLPIADAVLGASAGFLFVVGLSRVFFFEKGAGYYFHSYAFLTKFSVFI